MPDILHLLKSFNISKVFVMADDQTNKNDNRYKL